ncbi:MAG: acetate--CoA ligase family protein [Burkholderiaceae bacterium]
MSDMSSKRSATDAAALPPPRASVREILHPRSVAIVGASDGEAKWGGRLLRHMIKFRMDGPVYPINPRAKELYGLPVFPTVSACPGPVDLAIVVLPKPHVQAAVEDCVAKGATCILTITAGYAEMGEDGARAQRKLVETARAGGARLIGPNCMGLMNTHHNLAATTCVALSSIPAWPVGGIGLASQSGGLMGAMLARGADIGAGFSTMVSAGNQADLDLNDFFEYLIDDPRSDVVCLYLESVKDAARFTALLARAAQAGKPVLITKAGRSEAGARAAQSHTASLAGAWPAFEATCRAHGAYLFETIYDLLHGAQMLQRGAFPTSRGVAVFSGSGGGGALLIDGLEAAGLESPTLTARTVEQLAPLMADSHRELPIDFGMRNKEATPDPDMPGGIVGMVLDRVMADDKVGAGALLLTTQPGMDNVAQAAIAAGTRQRKPLLFVHAAGDVGESARALLRKHGYGYVDSPHDALKVLAALIDRQAPAPVDAGLPQAVNALRERLPALPEGYLTEPAARRLLEAAGIATTPWREARSIDEAVAAARALGTPVAIKGISARIVHKSDAGVVKLNVSGDAAVREACAAIDSAARAAGVTALDGWLVTEMVRADAELILGVNTDPDFGPMLMIGAGGVLVELMHDVQLAPAPVSQAQARGMIDGLRTRALLTGFRGRPPADLARIADALYRLGLLAAALGPRLRELDVNPLLVAGGTIVAADARAVLGADA